LLQALAFSAKYIMKCDDDTFVKLGAVINEVKKVPEGRSLYIGNMNYYHKPLRGGKWAVTYEEWPEEDYPPYANGPGYVLSSDIARFIVDKFERHKLRVSKREIQTNCIIFFPLLILCCSHIPAVQDGGRECGNVG
jgi:hypothetical protein